MSMAWALIARDVRRGYAGGGAALVCGFFLLAVILFPFAIGPDRALLARIGAGAIWVAALLAALLPVDRLVAPDRDAGILDQIALRGISEEMVVIARLIAHWLGFGPPLMIVSLKAGGTGLNLTRANHVFHYDRWWNPAVESQAIDRAHRIGRTRPVVAYRLIAGNTVEEKVMKLQTQKRQLAAALFGGERGTLREMTRDDLEMLLS